MYPQTEKKINELFQEGIIPGANFAFIKQGDVSLQTLGYAQVSPVKIPLTADYLFDVASLTKVIGTNTLLLKHWEAGQLTLTTPLHRYLPTFKNTDITLLELLTHTSDVQAYIENRDQLTANELKDALLQLSPGSKKGQTVQYTDTGTLLFGFLFEHLYHTPIQQQLTEQVLEPLGMNHSTFSPEPSALIAPTEQHPVRGLIKGQVHDPKAFTLGAHCGSAGLFSTIKDCLIFVQMMLATGKTQQGDTFLKEKTIRALLQDWTGDKALGRSLGWDLLPGKAEELPLLYHTGYTGTFMIIDIYNQEAFIFLSNRVHPVDNRDAYLAKRDELIQIYLQEK